MNDYASEYLVTGTETNIGLLARGSVKHSSMLLSRPCCPMHTEYSQLNPISQSAHLSPVFRNLSLTLKTMVRIGC